MKNLLLGIAIFISANAALADTFEVINLEEPLYLVINKISLKPLRYDRSYNSAAKEFAINLGNGNQVGNNIEKVKYLTFRDKLFKQINRDKKIEQYKKTRDSVYKVYNPLRYELNKLTAQHIQVSRFVTDLKKPVLYITPFKSAMDNFDTNLNKWQKQNQKSFSKAKTEIDKYELALLNKSVAAQGKLMKLNMDMISQIEQADNKYKINTNIGCHRKTVIPNKTLPKIQTGRIKDEAINCLTQLIKAHDYLNQELTSIKIRKKDDTAHSLNEEAEAFRKTLKIGDVTHCGPVLDVNGASVMVKTEIGPYKFNIDQIFKPNTVRCKFAGKYYIDVELDD